MDRRSFMKRAGAVTGSAAVAGSTFAAPAIAQSRMELKMVTSWPKNFPGLGTGAQRTADAITELTEGRLTVKVFSAGELVPPLEVFDAVSAGTAELYHSADYYFQGKHKAFNFFTGVPLGMTAFEFSGWVYDLGGQDLWDELGAEFNVKAFAAGSTGTQMAGWFNREIDSPEDLKGLKFRTPGLPGEAMRRLGVNVVNLPGGEIFAALQSGALDGAEWVGPWNDLAFGFYKVTKNYYYPTVFEGGSALAVGINKGLWDKLSATDQALIEHVCKSAYTQVYADFMANNGQALEQLVGEHGVVLRRFPDDVTLAMGKASAEVMAEIGAEGGLTQRVYESYQKATNSMRHASQVAEQAYMQAREQVLSSQG